MACRVVACLGGRPRLNLPSRPLGGGRSGFGSSRAVSPGMSIGSQTATLIAIASIESKIHADAVGANRSMMTNGA